MSIFQRTSDVVRFYLVSLIVSLLSLRISFIILEDFFGGGVFMAFSLFISVLVNWGKGEEIKTVFDALDCVDTIDGIDDFGFSFFD